MKLTNDIDDLSTRGRFALLGALALCCLVPMLVVLGGIRLTGAVFGTAAVVVVAVVSFVVWSVWMGRHHHQMAGHQQSAERTD